MPLAPLALAGKSVLAAAGVGFGGGTVRCCVRLFTETVSTHSRGLLRKSVASASSTGIKLVLLCAPRLLSLLGDEEVERAEQTDIAP